MEKKRCGGEGDEEWDVAGCRCVESIGGYVLTSRFDLPRTPVGKPLPPFPTAPPPLHHSEDTKQRDSQ